MSPTSLFDAYRSVSLTSHFIFRLHPNHTTNFISFKFTLSPLHPIATHTRTTRCEVKSIDDALPVLRSLAHSLLVCENIRSYSLVDRYVRPEGGTRTLTRRHTKFLRHWQKTALRLWRIVVSLYAFQLKTMLQRCTCVRIYAFTLLLPRFPINTRFFIIIIMFLLFYLMFAFVCYFPIRRISRQLMTYEMMSYLQNILAFALSLHFPH